jgi:nitrogen-specific signal transduction histidine kinase/HAMP domain-containing protein
MKSKSLTLNAKFTLTIGLILLIFCVVFSFLLYGHLKNRVIEDAREKTLIIMTQVSAIGDYIKNTLRPRMFEFLKSTDANDAFIVEAMSTTHVTQEVMKRFNADLKDYIYRRVSDNPLNPKDKADSLHEELISKFRKESRQNSWNGIIRIGKEDYIIRAKAIVSDKGCLACHGDPASAPKGLVKKYGTKSGFWWKEGDVVGIESVTIPLSITLGQIKGIAISTFVFGFTTLLFLFISLQGAFWSLVSRPLGRLTTLFKGIANGTEPLNQDLKITARDEIGELTDSFNQMARHLYNAQEDLKKNAENLRSIFEGISDPLALVNPDCTLEITNKAYRDWIAKGRSAVFTKRCRPENCDADTMCPVCYLKKVKEERKAVSEYWEGEDGRHYYIHLYPISDDSGNVLKAVHYVKDITDKKQIDEQMRLTEKLAAVGQLSAGIAHEINNPLGGIRLCFHNLINTGMDDETRDAHIEVINTGLDRIQNIIKQLMDFSKKSSLSVSPVSLNSLIENVLKLTDYLISKKNITVSKRLSPRIADIMVDPNKMEQVFLNIILNAVQAIDGKGGSLHIETTFDGGYCIASFSDSGPGIPDTVLPYVFDPFFTTKPVGEGTGLGLSVSKSIIEQHRGEIIVDASERGTKFTVRLPAQS